MNCNNCGTKLSDTFCTSCGQRKNSGRIVLKESAREVLEHYFDFDTPLFRTIKRLTIRPSKVIKEYIFGKRKSYAHPFRYFILVLAIYIIIKNLIDFDPIKVFSEVIGARELPDPNAISTKASNFFSSHINSFLFIYTFTLAGFTKLFNRKSGFYFIEYLALGFFVIAQYMFFSIFITLLSSISPYFFLLNYILILIYPMYVLMTFHEGKLIFKLIKAFFVSVLAWFLYAFLGQIISIFIVIYFNL